MTQDQAERECARRLRLVDAFMASGNEAFAQFLREQYVPSVYTPELMKPFPNIEECEEVAKRDLLRRIEDLRIIMGRVGPQKPSSSTLQCQVEGCEGPHCSKCGHHYDPACVPGNVCDSCLMDRGRQEMEAVTQAFGGNHEEAAKYMGW